MTPDQQKAQFASVGDVLELPEDKLDAFLALTSSGPAFVPAEAWLMECGCGLARTGPIRPSHPGGPPNSASARAQSRGRMDMAPRRDDHRNLRALNAERFVLP